MPLLDLRTDLKSLKYGSDRLGGGDSGLPYIKKDINTANTGEKFDDGLVRGGVVNAAIASAVDTTRIAKFLTDLPKGPLFIVKQVGLQLSNPRLEVPKNPANIASGLPDNVLSVGTNGLLQPTRVYNLGLNTLAQVPINFLGLHINRHGILPVQTDASKYEAIVTANNDLGGSSKFNRLVRLTDKFKLGDRTPNLTIDRRITNTLNTIFQAVSLVTGTPIKPLKVNPQDLIIDDYAAGPGSVYGIGRTTINRYANTEDGFRINLLTTFSKDYAGKTRNQTTGTPQPVNFSQNKGTGPNSISTYSEITKIEPNDINASINLNTIQYNPALKTYATLQKQVNQQQQLKNPNKLTTIESGSSLINIPYNQFGIYVTNRGAGDGDLNANNDVFNVGNYFTSTNQPKIGYVNSYGDKVIINKQNWNAASRAVRVGSGRTDSINLTPLFKAGIGNDNSVVTIGNNTYTINDLCKFRIEAIDGDDPSKSIFMIFRAYLTDLSDDVSADWNDIKYAGRGEKFYIYSGFSRKINISFKVAALSAKEMEPMYQKLNNLMGNLMPDYTPGNTGGFPGTTSGVMRGPLVRMTIGNWIDSQPGVLNSLSYKVPQDSPWEIALNEPTLGGSKEMVLPHIVEVNLSFTPIGSQTQEINKTPNKASDTQHTSHIAQNYNGTSPGEPNYITGSTIETATFPGGAPSTTY
jgi:hypothetical protein